MFSKYSLSKSFSLSLILPSISKNILFVCKAIFSISFLLSSRLVSNEIFMPSTFSSKSFIISSRDSSEILIPSILSMKYPCISSILLLILVVESSSCCLSLLISNDISVCLDKISSVKLKNSSLLTILDSKSTKRSFISFSLFLI